MCWICSRTCAAPVIRTIRRSRDQAPRRSDSRSMAGTAMLLLCQLDLLELNRHRRAGVDLQGEDALLGGVPGVLVDHFAHRDAVDLVDEVIALGDDGVLVPVVLFN